MDKAIKQALEAANEFLNNAYIGKAEALFKRSTELLENLVAALSAEQQEEAQIPNECAATGTTCSYGPHGMRGERQCKFCGIAAPVTVQPQEQPKPVAFYERKEGHLQEYVLRWTVPGLPIPEGAFPLYAAPVTVQPAAPMDWPLPCDITVGAGTIKKGVKLRVLVKRMETLHSMAVQPASKPEVAGWRYKKPKCNANGDVIGYSDWVLTERRDFLDWWPHEELGALTRCATSKEASEPKCDGQCFECDCGRMGSKEASAPARDDVPAYRIYKDGGKWCAVKPDFINLQESAAGFGDTPEQAFAALCGGDILTYISECFEAAEAEGLANALSETADERLKDLVERRLMYAYYAVQGASHSHPAQAGKEASEAAQEPADYQIREIGEGDWKRVSKEQMEAVISSPHIDYRVLYSAQAAQPCRDDVIEECAKVCETFYNHEAKDCAEAIRSLRTQPAEPVQAVTLTDEEVMARCRDAGIMWIRPDHVSPGMFEMAPMENMRRLLAGSAKGEAE